MDSPQEQLEQVAKQLKILRLFHSLLSAQIMFNLSKKVRFSLSMLDRNDANINADEVPHLPSQFPSHRVLR